MFQQLGPRSSEPGLHSAPRAKAAAQNGAAAWAQGETYDTKDGSCHLLALTPFLARLGWVWGAGVSEAGRLGREWSEEGRPGQLNKHQRAPPGRGHWGRRQETKGVGRRSLADAYVTGMKVGGQARKNEKCSPQEIQLWGAFPSF